MMGQILQGFIVSLGLIVAIGAQNAFILKQGLLKQHIFWACLICFLCDVVLMSIGILGFGALIAQNNTISIIFAIVGALFLFGYGIRSLHSSIKGSNAMLIDASDQQPRHQIILTTLAITLLNPHVYLDTVVIIGSVAGTMNASERYLFLLGSIIASTCWFFGLGYGARLLTPLFKKPKTWQILDAIITIIMWSIAIGLVKYAYTMMAK